MPGLDPPTSKPEGSLNAKAPLTLKPPGGGYTGLWSLSTHPRNVARLCAQTAPSIRVWGLGFGVWGLGFGVWGLGFGVWGSALKPTTRNCFVKPAMPRIPGQVWTSFGQATRHNSVS